VPGNILITGGAGFLGSSLAARLCGRTPVVLLDNMRRNSLASGALLDRPNVELRVGDVRDPACVARALAGCRAVVHMASVAGVDAVCADPVGTLRTAMLGAENVLGACNLRDGIERVVIVSSSEVYGPRAEGVAEDRALVPGGMNVSRWSYAVGKLAAERLALAYHEQYGLPVTIVRPFNVYGPGQTGQGAVRVFVSRVLAGRTLNLVNGGGQVRAWCYLDDFIDGLVRAMNEPAAVGEVFNLGNPKATLTVRELAEKVNLLAGSELPFGLEKHNGPDVDVRVPDISKARRLLGFDPSVDLDSGLKRTLDWYRRQRIDPLEVSNG